MAWSTPLTAVSNSVLTAAQWNSSVRDNLLETAAAKATTAGSHFAVTAANTLAERKCQTATVATQQDTGGSTGSYVNLSTDGPTITATCGVLAITWAQCQMNNNTTDATTYFSVDITGATTDAAADARAAIWEDVADRDFRFTTTTLHSLTAGSSTFKIKYKCQSNVGVFSKRNLIVMPL